MGSYTIRRSTTVKMRISKQQGNGLCPHNILLFFNYYLFDFYNNVEQKWSKIVKNRIVNFIPNRFLSLPPKFLLMPKSWLSLSDIEMRNQPMYTRAIVALPLGYIVLGHTKNFIVKQHVVLYMNYSYLFRWWSFFVALKRLCVFWLVLRKQYYLELQNI